MLLPHVNQIIITNSQEITLSEFLFPYAQLNGSNTQSDKHALILTRSKNGWNFLLFVSACYVFSFILVATITRATSNWFKKRWLVIHNDDHANKNRTNVKRAEFIFHFCLIAGGHVTHCLQWSVKSKIGSILGWIQKKTKNKIWTRTKYFVFVLWCALMTTLYTANERTQCRQLMAYAFFTRILQAFASRTKCEHFLFY